MSPIGEKVISIDVLAKGMSKYLASIRVKASEGVMQKARHVGEGVKVLRISGKLKA
jgi:hypothetical protein